MDIKIDLHTHSILSPDGGLSENDYKSLFQHKALNVIAVTDHNSLKYAQQLQKKLGNKIIVGEEVCSKQGEIIGLFLTDEIPAGLTAAETVKQIKKQNGVVCIPHPFETVRQGISKNVLDEIIEDVDLIEVFNGRSLQTNMRKFALDATREYAKVGVANSDAHCRLGIGRTYNLISTMPTKKSLVDLLAKGTRNEKGSFWLAYLCPKINRIKKYFNL